MSFVICLFLELVVWDGQAKKKVTSLPSFPTSISAIAFNHDGSELAIASSYVFEDGEREHPRDEIYLRSMLEWECQPRNRSSSEK
jgi:cell cycle arrest protein BUB3